MSITLTQKLLHQTTWQSSNSVCHYCNGYIFIIKGYASSRLKEQTTLCADDLQEHTLTYPHLTFRKTTSKITGYRSSKFLSVAYLYSHMIPTSLIVYYFSTLLTNFFIIIIKHLYNTLLVE